MVGGEQDADAPRIADHGGADLEQPHPNRRRARRGQIGASQADLAQALHQRIGECR